MYVCIFCGPWHTYVLYIIFDQLEEEARESRLMLAEARREASEAVIEAAKKQMENAHNLATQTAISAAKAAVKAALLKQFREENYTSASGFDDVTSDATTTTEDGTEQVSTEVETSIVQHRTWVVVPRIILLYMYVYIEGSLFIILYLL